MQQAFWRSFSLTSWAQWEQTLPDSSSVRRWCPVLCLHISSGWLSCGWSPSRRPECCPAGISPALPQSSETASSEPPPAHEWWSGWFPRRHPAEFNNIVSKNYITTASKNVLVCGRVSPRIVRPHTCTCALHTETSWSWRRSSPQTRRGRKPRYHSAPDASTKNQFFNKNTCHMMHARY